MRRLVVDRGRVLENAADVRRAAGDAAVYGVVKADGYGLGLEPMARTLSAAGIDRFAVTEPADAMALGNMSLPAREILLLRPVTMRDELAALLRLPNAVFSVGSAEEAVILSRAGLGAGVRPKAHVQIDVGLGRYGLPWDSPEQLRFLYASFTALQICGIYTHFSNAVCERTTRTQYRRFLAASAALEEAGIDPGTRHCCASSALMRHPEMALDAVRIGSAFLGRIPDAARFGLGDACRCEATIETVRSVRAGQTVGYGSAYRARRDMRIAVADIGASHGLGAEIPCGRRSPAAAAAEVLRMARDLMRGGLTAEIGGTRAPVLGQLCSECAILDVTGCDCRPGDVARFPMNPLHCRGVERVWQGGDRLPERVYPRREKRSLPGKRHFVRKSFS